MKISDKARQQAESCRFCWMCRHVCPIGNADGQERNNARARALMVSYVIRGTEKLEDIATNMYECSLCGACANNCKTGWDPRLFIQEVKTQIILEGKEPEYIRKLLDNYSSCGAVFGKMDKGAQQLLQKMQEEYSDGKVLLLAGEMAVNKDAESLEKTLKLLSKGSESICLDKSADNTGYSLWYLTGKTKETVECARKCAEALNKYEKVVVYNPVELSFIRHEWKEWGITLKARVVGLNEELLDLINNDKLKVRKSDIEYSLQDNFAYARELDDVTSGRQLIEKVGIVKDMLLINKEANLAGQLIMNEYMPNTMKLVAKNRWMNAMNMGCKTLVTENPDEHVLLKENVPEGYKVITVEEMVLDNLA
ncbi:MAG: (Fe-S)-binding protein [Bacilli bacterium]|nr:(Fe-S)-binding protein [Bacilli bacterium]